ncbi:head decoration protein [Bartonella sp. CB60]|uniref:head decoration protein n=1 Tax=Bartonella sp. CB60 TaxID=3113619 RepID=UPI00300DE636
MSHVYTEGLWSAEYLVEDSIAISREEVIISKGQELESGTVLARLYATGKYVALKPSTKPSKDDEPSKSDGSDIACAICYDNVDARESDTKATITARLSAVSAEALIWPKDITPEQKMKAVHDLAENQIILR